MSAFIVDRRHIDVMLAAAFHFGRAGLHRPLSWQHGANWRTGAEPRELTQDNADEVGRMLWRENLRSVQYRYPDTVATDDDYPAPVGFHREEIAEYRYTPPRFVPTAGETFKAVACYDYQSCEHPEWRDSEAYGFCRALEGAVMAALHKGPWQWDAYQVAKRIDPYGLSGPDAVEGRSPANRKKEETELVPVGPE